MAIDFKPGENRNIIAGTDELKRHGRIFQSYLEQNRWQREVMNRMDSAASTEATRTDLFRQYSKEAIDLAKEHGLHHLELSTRITRYQVLLTRDLTGQTLDELREELDCQYGTQGTIELSRSLSDDFNRYVSEANDVYNEALTTANPSFATIDAASKMAIAFSVSQSYDFQEILDILGSATAERAKMVKQFRTLVKNVRNDTERICNDLRVGLFLLAADLMNRRKSFDVAESSFEAAESLCQSPKNRWNVYMDWASFCENQGNLDDAKDHAEKAVKAAKEANLVQLQEQATNKLDNLLARIANAGSQSSAPSGLSATEGVMAILELALQALLSRDFKNAMNLIDKALEEAGRSPLRRQVLARRAAAYIEQDELGKAESDLTECISLLSTELDCDLDVAKGALDGRLIEEEYMFLLKAFVVAKNRQSMRSTQAWECAEKGRSGRLKRELKAAQKSVSLSLNDPTFASTSEWFRSNQAAIVSFAPTRWGTLALTAGPGDDKPEAQILDKFTGGELNRILVPIGADGSPENPDWDKRILSADVVRNLSEGLIHPLSKRLRAITQSAKVLYIIPTSALYCAPFAALTLDSSPSAQTLIDLCPLAFTPSTAILLWLATGRDPASSNECLAVGVGESQGFKFHDHLEQITPAGWRTPPVQLRDEAATIKAVSTQAPRFPVLYFSCHGIVSEESRDLMASSELVLAAGEKHLSAQAVAKWDLHAKLVFLNACQSGRFRQAAHSEVNGFVRAFLLAGARSLIAPLIRVDPRAAGELALAFFQEWLRGASTAEALRAAQFAVRKKDPQNIQWATYYLTGDFRQSGNAIG